MRKRRDVIGEGPVVNINHELVAVLGNRREAVSPL
jgi:hypothetical protein